MSTIKAKQPKIITYFDTSSKVLYELAEGKKTDEAWVKVTGLQKRLIIQWQKEGLDVIYAEGKFHPFKHPKKPDLQWDEVAIPNKIEIVDGVPRQTWTIIKISKDDKVEKTMSICKEKVSQLEVEYNGIFFNPQEDLPPLYEKMDMDNRHKNEEREDDEDVVVGYNWIDQRNKPHFITFDQTKEIISKCNKAIQTQYDIAAKWLKAIEEEDEDFPFIWE